MKQMIGQNKTSQITKRLDDIEVSDRRMASQVQMILEQQNKLLHSYYQLDSKYRDVTKENKNLRSDFNELKKRFDWANVGTSSD